MFILWGIVVCEHFSSASLHVTIHGMSINPAHSVCLHETQIFHYFSEHDKAGQCKLHMLFGNSEVSIVQLRHVGQGDIIRAFSVCIHSVACNVHIVIDGAQCTQVISILYPV